MSSCTFIFNAPAISFSKKDLYSNDFVFGESASYIKAISDSFFLSNEFRKTNVLYYCTQHKEEPIIIVFDGKTIRYLGPSFFSAAHLLLRAKNHLINPNSKTGKLTPGLTIIKQSPEWVFDRYMEEELALIQKSPKILEMDQMEPYLDSNVFLFGFEKIPAKYQQIEIPLGPLTIYEQVIMINYFRDQVV